MAVWYFFLPRMPSLLHLLTLRLVSAVGMLIVDNLQQLCRPVDDGGDSDDDDNGVIPAGELPVWQQWRERRRRARGRIESMHIPQIIKKKKPR